MLEVSPMAAFHSLSQYDQNKMQHDVLVMWCHWHQHPMMLMVLSMGRDTDARSGTNIGIKCHNISIQISKLKMKWCHSFYHQYHKTGDILLPCTCPKLICPSNVTYKPWMPINSSALETTMSVYMPHINSMQSTMIPRTLVYTHFTLLAYVS